jgi:hypothetical protein
VTAQVTITAERTQMTGFKELSVKPGTMMRSMKEILKYGLCSFRDDRMTVACDFCTYIILKPVLTFEFLLIRCSFKVITLDFVFTSWLDSLKSLTAKQVFKFLSYDRRNM